VTSYFRHQNPEKRGLNAQVATNGHTHILFYLWRRNRKCVYVWHLQRMWHTLTSLSALILYVTADVCVLFTLLLSLDVNLVPVCSDFVPLTCLSYISWVWKCLNYLKWKCVFSLCHHLYFTLPQAWGKVKNVQRFRKSLIFTKL
jgi:hypothetical protein